MNKHEAISQLKAINHKLEHLSSASALIQWDMRTGAPKKALSDRGQLLAFLAGEAHKLKTSERLPAIFEALEAEPALTDAEYGMLRQTKKQYVQNKQIPVERKEFYSKTISLAEAAWMESKGKNDWATFQPHLRSVIDIQKEMAEYYGYDKNIYDALLDQYEPDITTEQLDSVFSELRTACIDLLDKVRCSDIEIDRSCLSGIYYEAEKKEFMIRLLEKMGFDFDAGRLDVSLHPFTTGFGKNDIRITTFASGSDFTAALFACIHEGGHGIYEQNIADELKGTGLATGVSMGIHESQSRFYENMLGRSEAFWDFFYPYLQEEFPAFSTIRQDTFFKAVNAVVPDPIRIKADELTYNLHIIIRYELEKALLNDTLSVEDLPDAWNEKYKKYLGISPKNYAEGVMQDTHWASGAIGYFPSYALGNLYSAQFFSKLKQDIPDVMKRVAKGEFGLVKGWLGDNIHRHGSVYLPEELIVRVTGEKLQARYFVEYLNEKYSKIYGL